MSKIAILADSSCDFTPERAQKAGFSVVPLQVAFEDGSVYRDGIDLTSEEFFKKLAASKQLPKTSQPTIETWMDAMKQFADYDDIIVITVSGKVSGSLSGASMARRMLREEEEFQPNIHLIDSMTASGAVAGFALEAVRMVREGCRAQEILNRLLYLQNHLAVYFIFDSLEYLRKGGRIGKATALAGKVMGIKPLLTFFEGEPKNVDKVRGVQAGCKKLVEGFLAARRRPASCHGDFVLCAGAR